MQGLREKYISIKDIMNIMDYDGTHRTCVNITGLTLKRIYRNKPREEKEEHDATINRALTALEKEAQG